MMTICSLGTPSYAVTHHVLDRASVVPFCFLVKKLVIVYEMVNGEEVDTMWGKVYTSTVAYLGGRGEESTSR